MMKLFNVLNYPLDKINLSNKQNVDYVVDHFIGSVFLSYKLFKNTTENILILTSTQSETSQIYNGLLSILNEDDLIVVPTDELIRVEYISQSKEMLAEQISAIYKLTQAKHKIVIASIQAVYKFYPSKNLFLSSVIKLKVGEEISIQELKTKLSRLGYFKTNKVDQSMSFAYRGDIVDIYSLNYPKPIRIEFFGDEIESIREFEIETQTSIKKDIKEIEILPASLNLLTDDELKNAEAKILNQYKLDVENDKSDEYKEKLFGNLNDDIERIKEHDFSNKFYKFMGFLQGFHFNLADFLDSYIVININEKKFNDMKEAIQKEANNFLMELHKNAKTISHLEYFNMKSSVYSKAKQNYFLNEIYDDSNVEAIDIKTPTVVSTNQSSSTNIFSSYINLGYKVVAVFHDPIHYKKAVELLKVLGLFYKEISGLDIDNFEDVYDVFLLHESFDIGYELPLEKIVVLTEKEIYGTHRHGSTFKKVFKEGRVIGSYEELSAGDYVVHENYGIGKYVGIVTLDVNGTTSDYMKVEYAGSDTLYVPLYQFNLIRKYVSREGRVPTIHKLNTNQWEKTKKRIRERVNELADRLLVLYQERQKVQGISFTIEDDLQKNFENEFPYELTLDQENSLAEIKKDMESETPMDRLLCGDVGFGKTEIAFRAAFKALNNGYQVALVCPTTLLARQHYDVATERFKNYDFGIGILSRLQKQSDNKMTREKIKSGEINFLIGTHAVLSKWVEFKNLGLLIIDEEQRFGVEQKERIKEKFTNIDVLTISATPIPRTLQSTLIGLKTTSNINTPPKERMPIQTYVIPFKLDVVKELINREISRSGQVFYVYNKVATIYERAQSLQAMLPGVKFAVVHAKMEKEEIENTMLSFYLGEIDVLVTTTIVENGIDVRNANLLLVEDADRFGLSQLYQIKGRVGRGDKLAFAYLMVNYDKGIREEATKRLRAIQEFTELGSGYKISQRDLLIRGAGDILGPEQAGFIDSIGIDMYIKILNEAVERKKNRSEAIYNKEKPFELTIDAFIPKEFATDEDKIELYQKIIGCKTIEELNNLVFQVEDMFGSFPEEAWNIFTKKEIQIYLSYDCFDGLKQYENNYQLFLSDKFSEIEGIGTELFTSLIPYIKYISMKYEDKKIKIVVNKVGKYVETLIEIMKIVVKLFNISIEKQNETR